MVLAPYAGVRRRKGAIGAALRTPSCSIDIDRQPGFSRCERCSIHMPKGQNEVEDDEFR